MFDESAYKKKVSEMQKEATLYAFTDALAKLDLIDELVEADLLKKNCLLYINFMLCYVRIMQKHRL